ncbi:hypothetical protein L3Y34_009594 [Caenorhabditis briggsae]|uniref:Nose resistant-to-fluoxetine protein N-terminal domain-containing protein n=1 Tax=Caenorhabditis briggsae TaxID=6238 RepID=A0AAE9ACJ3_CAEBR|nr:hypothetical protein L3Y34_009594 [Caenorhabditis briggsae]
MKLFLLLFLSSFSIGSATTDNWTNLHRHPKNITGVSTKCQNDTETWLKSLEILKIVSLECLISKKCSKTELKLLEENFYALEQLDAFGKFPSTGIFEIPLLFDGSYQECQRISGKKYDTNYCYVVLVPGKDSKKCHVDKNGDSTPTTIFWRSAVYVLLPVTSFNKHLWNHLILNAFFSVDTFFLLSGIVVAYLFFKNPLKKAQITSPITWILFYVHRYLRLTPPLMIFIGFYIAYSEYIQGPTAAAGLNSITYAVNGCKKTWWRNLLYINNFGDSTQACYGITWYLAVDTQLYLIAPIILIALWFSFLFGFLTVVAGCAGSIITVYILYAQYHLPADQFGKGNLLDFGKMIYQKPWIRCTPYLVGLLVGYGLTNFGKRRIRLNWYLAIIGWLIALGIAIACLFSTNDYDKGAVWTDFEKATYYNFSRFLWSIAVSWVIVANHMGWGGPINNFMSHPIWQPLGRLSYCAYIVHFFLIPFYENLDVSPMHYYSTFQIWIYYAVPITIIAYIFAFFWSCLFEISTLKLEKMLIEAILGAGHQRASGKIDDVTKVEKLEKEKEEKSENVETKL